MGLTMPPFITGLLHNDITGRYHPISFRESPLPGNNVNRPLEAQVMRHKSIGHHTEGFATKEEADKWITDNKDRCTYVPNVWEWANEDVPAMVAFFDLSKNPPQYLF